MQGGGHQTGSMRDFRQVELLSLQVALGGGDTVGSVIQAPHKTPLHMDKMV